MCVEKSIALSLFFTISLKISNISSLETEYIACKELDDYIEGLISADKKSVFEKAGLKPEEPDLEQIMVYLERSKSNESFTL